MAFYGLILLLISALNFIVKVMTKGFEKAKKETESPSQELKPLIGYCMAVQLVKHTDDGVTAARLIEQHNLKIEHVPTVLLNSLEVFTVNSKIFARTLFLRNFAYAKFRENKTLVKWQNHSFLY